MTIERMRIFAEVVKLGSFTRAAESLDASKGYVSTQIKQLEKECGKQLLVRNTRNMRLTTAGEIVYNQAERLRSLWSDTQTLLNLQEDTLAGQINCTAPMGLARYVLWPIFSKLMATNPEIQVAVDSGNTTHNLLADSFDFAVRITNTPPEDMVAYKLCHFDYICCATPKFIGQYGIPRSLTDLSQMPTLALTHWRFWQFDVDGKQEKLDLSPRFLASDNELLKQALLNHQGIARLPSYMVNKEIETGELIRLLPEYSGECKDIYLLYPQMSSRPLRVNFCIQQLKQAFSEHC